jgi:hypothetical protein
MEQELNKCVLAQNGYKCRVVVRPPFRGHTGLRPIITAERDGRVGIVTLVDKARLPHYQRIQAIQDRLQHVAKITDIVDRAIITAAAAGTLLWEMESRPPVELLRPRLEEFVTSLSRERLVHADLRPWNVFLDHQTASITVIDWGFSFFIGEPDNRPEGHLHARGHQNTQLDRVDETDSARTLKVISGELSPEEAWFHTPDSWDWRAPWVQRSHS